MSSRMFVSRINGFERLLESISNSDRVTLPTCGDNSNPILRSLPDSLANFRISAILCRCFAVFPVFGPRCRRGLWRRATSFWFCRNSSFILARASPATQRSHARQSVGFLWIAHVLANMATKLLAPSATTVKWHAEIFSEKQHSQRLLNSGRSIR